MSKTFILPSAGKGLRLHSEKPVLLTQFADGQYLYEKQINTIRKIYPNSRIIYITGFNCDKIDTRLKMMDCEVIHNLNYEETTTVYSIYLALRKLATPATIIYGNIFFDKTLLKIINALQENNSYILTNKTFNKNGIGVNHLSSFDFSFDNKWTKIVILSPFSIYYFNKLIENSICNHKKFVFEILNEMIHLGDNMRQISIDIFLKEIHKIKDVKEINRYLGEVPPKPSLNQ